MTKRFRFFVVAALLAFGAAFMFPTIQWYYLIDQDTKGIVSGTKESIRSESEEKAQILVDRLVAEAKANPGAVFPAEYGYLVEEAKAFHSKNKIPTPAVWTYKDVIGAFPADVDSTTKKDLPSSKAFIKAVTNHYRTYFMDLKVQKSSIINLGLDLQGGISAVLQADTTRLKEKNGGLEPDDQTKKDALNNAVEALKGRVDAFGISEPSIRADEENLRITIDIPGDNDKETINRFLVGGGNLKLQLVDEEASSAFNAYIEQFSASNNGRSWKMDDPLPPAGIPAGTQIREVVLKDEFSIDYVAGYVVTKETSESIVDGEYIIKANPSRDEYGKPTATFTLNAEGASKFQVLTRDNVGKPMAIVMDGRLKGFPINISQEISGGNVQITGFDYDEAAAISKILRSGSLPLDLRVEGQQVVGASLGEDAIRSGLYAAGLGIILVLIFMFLYYLGAGLVANIALVLNVYLMVAILSSFGLTLTLTSIAGLILTIGMAVDANVIIFERIKEELRIGKSRAAAIKAGYQKAFWAIMDGNITTLIASVLLMSFGTGPIKGFAVTLTVGIITSMFTALFVTRLIQDFGTEQLGKTKMSISWRLK